MMQVLAPGEGHTVKMCNASVNGFHQSSSKIDGKHQTNGHNVFLCWTKEM